MGRETKEEKKVEETKRGQRPFLGRERALRVGLCEVYSPSALLHGPELAADARVNRIGMHHQGQHNQHQLPLIQKTVGLALRLFCFQPGSADSAEEAGVLTARGRC